MPTTSSTTQTFDPKTSLSYRIRTMASDLEAIKKGSVPSSIPIIINLPKEPPKKEITEQPQNAKTKLELPPLSKDYKYEDKKFDQERKNPPIAIKPSFPKITYEKPEEKTEFLDWLKKKDEIVPQKIQPFLSPIKGPMIPKQQTTSVPPPGLPTMQAPPNLPVRPLTPPPPPRPPMPQMPQMQKLPSIPTMPGLPPIQQLSTLPKTKSALPSKKGRMVAIVVVSIFILTFIAGEIWWFFLREAPAPTQQISDVLPPPQNVEPLSPESTATIAEEPVIPSPILSYSRSEIIDLETLTGASNLASTDEFVRLVVKSPTAQTTNEYADIATIAKQLNIKIPADVSEEFLSDFDMFIFGGNSFDKEECIKAKNTDEACYGPRLGIAVKVLDPKNAMSALKAWEKTMATDLKPMILAKAGNSASSSFLQNLQNKSIRYKNMPINTMTVEYAFAGDILIITTSKSAVYKALDSLPVSTENTTE